MSMRTSVEAQTAWPLFDPLRFVLASTVALAHFGVITDRYSSNFAVQVFFALSGWLIGGILLRTGRAGLSRFFYNRVTRIWVPYMLAVIALYAVGAAKSGVDGDFFRFLFYDLTFTHNWFINKVPAVLHRMPLDGTGAHFWSLAVEEQFYLGAPLLIVLLGWGRWPLIWVGVFVLQFLLLGGWYGAVSLGVGAAALRLRDGDWHETRAGRFGLLAAASVAVLALGVGAVPYAYAAPVLAIAVVLLCARRGPRSGGLLTFMGGMSFPLYLNHWMGIFVANLLAKKLALGSHLTTGIVGYALAVAIGALTYVLVDKRVLAGREAAYTPARGRLAMTLAYGTMTVGVLGALLFVGRV